MAEPQHTISDYIIKNKCIKHWETIIEEWIVAVEKFTRITNDAPYWYDERANVSVLAGAAWRSGKIALEEFQQNKTETANQQDEQHIKERRGRSDLWIQDERNSDFVEAKFKWLNLADNNKNTIAQKTLESAVADAERVAPYENFGKIGVAFLPVYIKKQDCPRVSSLNGKIYSAIDEILSIKCSLVAWTFPRKMRDYIYNDDERLPGIILLAKKI